MTSERNSDTQLGAEPPSNDEIEREKDPTRKALLAAIQRLMMGHPKIVSPGARSIGDLAKEAGQGRHHLYQGSADLRDRFVYLRDHADQPTAKEVSLQRRLDRAEAHVVKMQALQIEMNQAARNWKELAELLARVVSTLEEELHQEQISTQRLARRVHGLEQQLGKQLRTSTLAKRPLGTA